jgi:hypothetical protein
MGKEVSKCKEGHTEVTPENKYHISPLYGLLYESSSYLCKTAKVQKIILSGDMNGKEV